jgi:hypothetical protein
MRLHLLKRIGGLGLAVLALACATPTRAERPVSPSQPDANAEPIPPPSQKKAVIVPSDVDLGPRPAGTVNSGAAGPAVSPAGGTPGAPQ